MARTRCGALSSSKVKVNFPWASVLAWPTSSMPAPSLIRITSSPAEGLLVVPLVTVPVRVAADATVDRSSVKTTTVRVNSRILVVPSAFKLRRPSGTKSTLPAFPALKRWVRLGRPFGAGASLNLLHGLHGDAVLVHEL